jgi:hypothetical protein
MYKDWAYSSVVQCLPCMHKALESNQIPQEEKRVSICKFVMCVLKKVFLACELPLDSLILIF